MLETTITAVKAIFKADPSITVSERSQLLATLRNGPTKTLPGEPPPTVRLVRPSEAAQRLGYSLRMVDRLSAQGILPKHRLPGRKRCAGILERDLIALLTQKETQ